MIDPQTQARLEAIVRRESRSLLQYVSESFPWVTPDEREALAQFKRLVDEERQGAGGLTRLLARRGHAFPYIGPYPMEYTTINYVSLEHLLPLLAGTERCSLAGLENDLAAIQDPEARAEVEKIVALKRRHAEILEAMAAAYPEKHSTIRGQAS